MLDQRALTIAASAVMTLPKQPDVHGPRLADPVADLVALVRAAPAEQASILLDFLAAFVQTDAAMDLGALDTLPEGIKPAVLRFFEHCLRVGLTDDELGALASVIRMSEAGSRQVH